MRQARVATAWALAGVIGCEFSSATGAPTTGGSEDGATTIASSEGGSAALGSDTARADTSTMGDGAGDDTTYAALDSTSDGSSSGDATAATDSGDEGGSSSTGDGIVTSMYCESPGVAIPDDDAGGVATQIVVPDAGIVLGVRVGLDVTHTHVGDLRLDLRHGEADRLLVSYPGGGGCSGDDILARLTDDAVSSVQTACTADTPALTGDLLPEFSLDAFIGLPMLGAWELRATDGGPMDTGTIAAWCLEIDHLP
jgi:hypothetical protein